MARNRFTETFDSWNVNIRAALLVVAIWVFGITTVVFFHYLLELISYLLNNYLEVVIGFAMGFGMLVLPFLFIRSLLRDDDKEREKEKARNHRPSAGGSF